MITEVSLERFKCFKTLESIELSRINLFAGSNGRGKSSFLQALLLIAQSMDAERRLNHIEINGKFVELGTFKDIISRGASTQSVNITFKTDDKEENEVKLVMAPYDKKPQWCKLARIGLPGGKELVEEIGSATGEDVSKKPKTLGATSTVAGFAQLHNVYYISADRKGPIDFAKQNDNREDNQIGIHGEYVINLLAHKGSGFISKVSNAISEILLGATVSVQETETDYLRLTIDSSNNSDGFRPSNVGFGYSYILPIVTTILFAEEGAKIFIENPEAHLHPGAQSRLTEFLIKHAKEKKLQLYVETHSDHVINCLRIAVSKELIHRSDAKIIYLSRKEDNTPKVSQISIDSHGNLSDYPDGFMDEWGIQMSQLV